MKTWEQVTEARYWEMLEVLPPAIMTGLGFMVGEAFDHGTCTVHNVIKPRYSAFAEIDGKFYGCTEPMTIAEFKRTTRQNVLEAA